MSGWEACRACGELTSVERPTVLVICDECRPAWDAERHRQWIADLIAGPLDIDRPEPDLDIERMLGMKVRRPPEAFTGNPDWFISGGLPSLGQGYS